MPTPELVALGIKAVEQELDRDFEAWFEAWQERWTTPAGMCSDAPDPPARYKTSPERIFLAVLKAHEEWLAEQGLVVVPREMTPAMAEAFYRYACSVEPPNPNDFTPQISKAWQATISAALQDSEKGE